MFIKITNAYAPKAAGKPKIIQKKQASDYFEALFNILYFMFKNLEPTPALLT